MVLCGALVMLSAIDIETRLLPDVITLPLTWCGLLANAAHLYTTPVLAILGAASGYAVLWLLYHAFRLVTGREGLGYGDFKLLAALGAWFGLAQLPGLLLCASASGVVVGLALIVSGRARRGEAQPFGPFLALAGVVNLLALGGAPWWN
jgi:leader peptidase (prepilin peptidase)/N-methyltransferase